MEEISLSGAPKSAFVGEQINFLLHIQGTAQEYMVEWETETPDGTNKDSVTTGAVDVLRSYIPHSYGTHTIRITVKAPDGSFKQAMAVIPVADHSTESEAEMFEAFEDYERTGNWNADLLAIAKSQIGYSESDRNFYIDNFDVTHGWTRYGAFYGGAEYDSWDALFVNFVARMAGIPEKYLPKKGTTAGLQKAMADEGAAIQANYILTTGEPGDLVFVQGTDDMQVGVLSEISDDKIAVILGDCDDRVQVVEYENGSELVLGFGDISVLYDKAVAENAPTEVAPETKADETEEEDEQGEAEEEERVSGRTGVIYYCGFAPGYQHTHDESCYQGGDVPLCGLFEHTHTDKCTELPLKEKEEEPEDETAGQPAVDAPIEGPSTGEVVDSETDDSTEEAPAQKYSCGLVEHSHSAECYSLTEFDTFEVAGQPVQRPKLICGMEEHTHDETCVPIEDEGAPTEDETENTGDETEEVTYYCGLEEHTHSEECYDAEGNLVCELPEHTHTDECLVAPEEEPEEPVYYCGMEEHTHTEECYDEEGNLICELEEHTHTEECLVPPEEEPEVEYICGKEEHTHSEECYDEEGNLICELEEHTHTEECVFDAFELRDQITTEAEAILAEAAEATAETPVATLVDYYNRMNDLYALVADAFDAGEISQAEYNYLRDIIAGYVAQLMEAFKALGYEPQVKVDVDAEFEYADENMTMTVHMLGTGELRDLAEEIDAEAMPKMVLSFEGEDGEAYTSVQEYIAANGPTSGIDYMASMQFQFTLDGHELDMTGAQMDVTVLPTAELIEALTAGYSNVAQYREAQAAAEAVELAPIEGHVESVDATEADINIREESGLPEELQVLMDAVEGAENAESQIQGEIMKIGGTGTQIGVPGLALGSGPVMSVPTPDEPSEDEASEGEPSADEPSADEPSADEPSIDEPSEGESVQNGAELEYIPVDPDTHQMDGDTLVFNAVTLDEEGEPTVVGSSLQSTSEGEIAPFGFSTIYSFTKLDFNLSKAYNPTYTLQHYVKYQKVKLEEGKGNNLLNRTTVNETGGLPSNGSANAQHVTMTQAADGTRYDIVTEATYSKLFADEKDQQYMDKPGIPQMDRLYNSRNDMDASYTLAEVWVSQSAIDDTNLKPDSATPSNVIRYLLPKNSDGTHDVEAITFITYDSNMTSNYFTNAKPGHTYDLSNYDTDSDGTGNGVAFSSSNPLMVKMTNDMIVRFVFDTTTQGKDINPDATFFDYDISDGYIYTDKDYTNKVNANTQADRDSHTPNPETSWMKSYNEGVNAASNNGEGTDKVTYAFGNSNAGTAYGERSHSTIGTLNMYNNTNKNAEGVTFGIVNGVKDLNGDYIPNFIDGVLATDNLFNRDMDGLVWKHMYDGSLTFKHVGNVYTLTSASAANGGVHADNLDTFIKSYHSTSKDLYSNMFWPMDDQKATEDSDRRDMYFGKGGLEGYRRGSEDKVLPKSDESGTGDDAEDADHNSYFGLKTQFDFTLDSGFAGPLDYFFYGDDDMWVFLGKVNDDGTVSSVEQIIDIGGVHSTVGAYVDLWQTETLKEYRHTDGTGNYIPYETDTSKVVHHKYRLFVFYTERGASGSSCYMRCTLPLATVQSPKAQYSSMTITKKVELDESLTEAQRTQLTEEMKQKNFRFKLSATNAAGESMDGNMAVLARFNSDTQGPSEGYMMVGSEFTLKWDDTVTFPKLFRGWTYTVKEQNESEEYYVLKFEEKSGEGNIEYQSDGVVFTDNGTDASVVFNNSYSYDDGRYKPTIEKSMVVTNAANQKVTIPAEGLTWMQDKTFKFKVYLNWTKTAIQNQDEGGEIFNNWVYVQGDNEKTEYTRDDPQSYTQELTVKQALTASTVLDKYFYFEHPGTYVFTIEEEAPEDTSIFPDGIVWDVYVPVNIERVLVNEGNPNAENAYEVQLVVDPDEVSYVNPDPEAAPGKTSSTGKAPFENDVHLTATEYTPKFTKEFLDGTPADTDEFTFTLSEIADGKHNYDGIQYFDKKDGTAQTMPYKVTLRGADLKDPTVPHDLGFIKFNQGGTYAWQIQETGHSTVKDCATDPHTWTLTVDVKEVDGKLYLNSVNYDDNDTDGHTISAEAAAFHNVYVQKIEGANDDDIQSGDIVDVGDVLTYRIPWTNPYTEHAADVTITDKLDAGLEYVDGSASNGGVYDAATRTITWTLMNQPANQKGEVSFKAKVIEAAKVADGSEHDLYNEAELKYGDYPEVKTNEVHNDVGEPHKEETVPGEGEPVEVGKEITYKITWRNYKNQAAEIVIKDVLDPGVDFVSASYGEVELKAPATNAGSVETYGITYEDKADRTQRVVTWTLNNIPAKTEGEVYLTVRVNSNAQANLDYDYTDGQPVKDTDKPDYEVQNQAGVKVGNDDEMFTEIPWNPVPETHKTENAPVKPGDQVEVGDTITYEIEWENYLREPAIVTVEDVLDPGVEFVSASFGDLTLNAGEASGKSIGDIRIDVSGKTVTWKLGEQAAKATGKVTLTVRVLKAAEAEDTYVSGAPGKKHTDENTVWNQASMQVGPDNTNKFWTEEIPNVVPEKTEEAIQHNTHPDEWNGKIPEGDKDGAPVLVGDEITYNIQYRAIWNGGSDGEKTVVTVTDTLDPGVDFVKATVEGSTVVLTDVGETAEGNVKIVYDGETVTWTLKDVDYGDVGNVKLTVKVNENARKNYQFKDGTPEEGNNKKGDANGDKYDYEVQNQAGVQIGDGNAVKYTQIPENPVPDPHKTEKIPGAGEQVQVGDKITYEIEWQNYSDNVATVTVSDVLDKGVKLVESETTEGFKYIEDERKVVWTFENQEPKAKGTVTLVVEVTKLAEAADTYESGEPDNTHGPEENTVWNQASVKVGNDPDVWTEEIPNVVPEKTETGVQHNIDNQDEKDAWDKTIPDGTDKNGAPVLVGDDITYTIQYKAMWPLAEGENENSTTTVTITDKLDPGVDFVSAKYKGVKLTKDDASPKTETVDDVTAKIEYAETEEVRTVTWTLDGVKYGEVGEVELTVKVNERAKEAFHFDQGEILEGNDKAKNDKKYDYEVQNQAGVQIGDGNDVKYTQIPENPVPDPHKTETAPLDPDGNPDILTVGSHVKYEIEWQNYEDDDANVTITDQLDPGVVFVSAKSGEVELTADKESVTEGNVTIGYDKETHTITWTLVKQASKAQGIVSFEVEVTKDSVRKAVNDWDYDESGVGDYRSETRDYAVVNQAKVEVGNNPGIRTEKPENPVFFPEKKEDEEKVGENNPVAIGEEITYYITWQNYHDVTANVTVTDRLDPGVDFVSASFNGVTLRANEAPIEEVPDNGGLPVSIRYVKKNGDKGHYVEWILHNRDGKTGSDWDNKLLLVELTVRVNENARIEATYGDPDTPSEGFITESADKEVTDFRVLNQASVEVDHDGQYFTDIIPNPVSEPKKEEVHITDDDVEITDGEGKQVHVGAKITYDITYQNYKYEELYEEGEELKSVVTVEDTLHPGVDFVEASANGVTLGKDQSEITGGNVTISYDSESRTVTWTIKDVPMGYEGKVTLTVQVNNNALNWQEYGTADETIGNENAIYNQAHVTLDEDRTFDTKVIPNPVLEKKETDIERKPTPDNPKEGEGWEDKHGDTNKEPVTVGDWITYHIEYTAINPNGEEGDDVSVVVKDVLDPGVNFVSASYGDLVLDAKNTNGKVTFQKNSIELTTTEAGQQMVTWTLTEKYGTHGDVVLVVEVNKDAEVAYSYENGQPKPGTDRDFKVFDQASVNIDNQGDVYTNIVENPVDEPHKTEEEEGYPQDQDVVTVGQRLKYDIEWHNSEEKDAKVVIRDPLDPHVKFISASYGDTTLTMWSNEIQKGDVKIEYKDHQVTWTIQNVASDTTDHVKLEVELLPSIMSEDVVKQWARNKAYVKIEDHPEVGTEVPENPVGEPHKIETDPGYGEEVAIGETISYEISWKNYQAQAADVTVNDRLDPGVDFVSASYDGVTLNASENNESVETEDAAKGITIEYDTDAHMVTWKLSQRDSGAYDKVALTVEVNDDARKTYTYNADGTINKGAKDGDPDYKVLDQAGVAVGDDAEVLTEIIPNPVPEKTEAEIEHADTKLGTDTAPQMHDVTVEGDEFKTESGPTVFVGDVITYHITYGAHKLDSDAGARVDVHIYDELDPGVEFVSASNYGYYDETTHSVTWTFDVPNNTDGYVELKVRVTKDAIQEDDDNGKHVVDNQAEVDVQVGSKGGVKTNIVENPTPEFTKTSETTNQPVHMPTINADGEVEGDTITYTIHWKNYKNEYNEDGTPKLATVTITDTLDPGVTLDVAAMNALGVDYDTKTEGDFTTVIWTIKDVEPLAEGNVTLIVKVNTDAPETWTYNEEDGTFIEDPDAPDGGYWVYNKAHMNVDNESEIYSEVIPNPVPHPSKTEQKPGEPTGVKPGDEIEYKVKWWNYAIDETTGKPIAQNVYVIDQLEPGLDLVSGTVKVYETDVTGEKIGEEIKVPSDDITYVNRKLSVKIAAGADMYGIVVFTAKVNANAVYGVTANNQPTTNVDEMVANKAQVQIGDNGEAWTTNEVSNPVPNPHKEETEPGNGEPVKLEVYDADGNLVSESSQIQYTIDWANYKTEKDLEAEGAEKTATVVITDKLDPGVDFVSASYDGVTLEGYAEAVTGEATGGVKVTISVEQKTEETPYDTVTWTLENVPARSNRVLSEDAERAKGSMGTVNLTVQLNENAVKEYRYELDEETGEPNGNPIYDENTDGRWVYNQASVKVNRDNEMYTEVPKNPVPEPPKTEDEIDRQQADGTKQSIELTEEDQREGGVPVKPGDEITYKIKWWNYETNEDGELVAADVTVTDALDEHVKFLEAGFDGEEPANAEITAPEGESGGTVKWTFHAERNTEGWVWVKVEVLDSIKEVDKIENQGGVKVGSHDEQKTNIIPNPPPKDDKVESGITTTGGRTITPEHGDPNDWQDTLVFVGDTIEYTISYENDRNVPATVTITDPLDPGVDFDDASDGGVYDAETHTVTWTLTDVPARMTGTVTLTVVVNQDATPAGKVDNQAQVQVDNDAPYLTEEPQNPTPEQEKTEVTPGAGKMVLPQNLASQQNNDEYEDIPQSITYQIAWENYQNDAAKVTVTDNLDPGVDYVQGSWTCEGYRPSFSAGDDGRHLSWIIDNVPAGAKGVIEFTVTVNENAYKTYTYPADGDELDAGSGTDDMLYNRAAVQVGNDPKVLTDIIPNPVPEVPKKVTGITGNTDWTNPPEDTIVFVGDTITYEIGWWNYAVDEDTLKPVAATVTVTDPLDEKVDFVSASEGGVYDEATRTVTWTIAAEADERGTVTLTVKVSDRANNGANIVNQAGAKVGEDHNVDSNPVKNPTPDLEKDELVPGADETVHVGDGINYQIHWKNYKPAETDAEGNEKLHTVVITDELDPGVDFLSASYAEGSPAGDEPVYDPASHTVTWTLHDQPGQAEGWVLLNVIVNAKARDGWHYENGTPVADDAEDNKVINQGGMRVDNDSKVLTNPVENPVPGPKKIESEIDHQASNLEDEVNPPMVDVTEDGENYKTVAGPEVFVGDEITYEITWRNYDEKAETSDITITDPLDRGVDFVSASVKEGPQGTYTYSGVTSHTVTWVIPGTKFGDEGKVTVTVRVNSSATATGVVENYAHVQVGNNPADETEHVENPTPNPRKEVAPGTGSPAANTQVDVGDTITYRVRYKNYKPEAATVTVRDRLDPDESGLDFIEAWAVFNGQRYSLTNTMAAGTATYVINPEAEREEQQAITISVSGKIVTWTMTNRPAGEEAYVYVTAQVNASALEGTPGTTRTGEVINYASVQVGDDPEVEVEPVQHNLGETPPPPPGGGPEPGVVTTSLTGNKFWDDNGDAAGLRPGDITVTLYRDGVAQTNRPTWTRNGNTWTYRFDNLPMYVPGTTDDNGENGTPYRYEVRETVVPENYRMSQNGNDITNTLLPPNVTYTTIGGTKTWNDNNDVAGLRPDSITVRLYRDGTEIDSVTVTAETNWRYSFTRLPVNDGYGGANYVYTVSEDPVENYYTVQNGTNFVNGLIPGREPGEPGPGDFTIINDAGVPLFGLPTEEELEDLIQLFDYDTPLWGDLMKTGDELPIYPFLFAGLGAAIVAVLLVDRKKRKAKAKG